MPCAYSGALSVIYRGSSVTNWLKTSEKVSKSVTKCNRIRITIQNLAGGREYTVETKFRTVGQRGYTIMVTHTLVQRGLCHTIPQYRHRIFRHSA
jgi:hypothetical protein